MSSVDRTSEFTSFADAAEWTGVCAEDREPWLALRRSMLTASDVAAVLGEDDRRSALDVYVDKITDRQAQEVITLNDPRFWGTVLEQPVLRAVATFYGWNYRPGGALLRSRRYPFLGATLDAEIERGDAIWVPLEGKTTRVPKGWDEESGALPTRVLIQVQTQLLITGAPLAVIFALLQGSRPVQIIVEPSPEFHEVIIEEGERFMAMVASLDPPSPDGKAAATRALHQLYPRENGAAVALPVESLDWTREYQAVSAQLRTLERRKDHFKQLLMHAIGPAMYGVLPEAVGSKRCWRWSTQKRDRYEVEASEQRVLLALKDAPSGSPAHALLPAANDTLIDALEESTSETEGAPRIRFGQRRRSTR